MGLRRFYATRLAPTRFFSAVNARMLAPLDRLAARVTRGRRTVTGAVFPTLLLTHRGRVTGEMHVTPLMYVEHGGGWAVMGTNYGRAEHPAWTANLLADPAAVVSIAGRSRPVRARVATEQERAELWPRFTRMYRGYESYVRRSGRTPRMFVLEPDPT